jgi:hypothetical protein
VITFHSHAREVEKERLAMIRPVRSSLQTITMVVILLLGGWLLGCRVKRRKRKRKRKEEKRKEKKARAGIEEQVYKKKEKKRRGGKTTQAPCGKMIPKKGLHPSNSH